MTNFQIVSVVFGIVVLGMLAAIPSMFLPMVFLTALCAVIGIFRIGSIVKAGFNEHTKAMQAIYDEVSRANRSVKAPGSSA